MRLARRNRFLERRPVHPRHHQHPARFCFLNDCRNQPVGVELQFIIKTHYYLCNLPNSGPPTTKKFLQCLDEFKERWKGFCRGERSAGGKSFLKKKFFER